MSLTFQSKVSCHCKKIQMVCWTRKSEWILFCKQRYTLNKVDVSGTGTLHWLRVTVNTCTWKNQWNSHSLFWIQVSCVNTLIFTWSSGGFFYRQFSKDIQSVLEMYLFAFIPLYFVIAIVLLVNTILLVKQQTFHHVSFFWFFFLINFVQSDYSNICSKFLHLCIFIDSFCDSLFQVIIFFLEMWSQFDVDMDLMELEHIGWMMLV